MNIPATLLMLSDYLSNSYVLHMDCKSFNPDIMKYMCSKSVINYTHISRFVHKHEFEKEINLLSDLTKDGYNTIFICDAVLNTIENTDVIKKLLKTASNFSLSVFNIFQGESNGKGRITNHGSYQRNDKSAFYEFLIYDSVPRAHYFEVVKRRNTIFMYGKTH